jgi:hypothetical protein
MTEAPTKKHKTVGGFEVPTTCDEEKLELAVRHAHPRDSLILFAETIPDSEETHQYFVRGESGYCSVSGFYSQWFEPFNNEREAIRMASRDDFWTNSRYKQYWVLGVDTDPPQDIADKIVQVWEANGELQSSLGTALHRRIELFCNDAKTLAFSSQDLEDYIRDRVSSGVALSDDIEKPFDHFLQLYKDTTSRGLVVLRTEIMMFDDESKLTGSADVIFIDKNQLTPENLAAWKSGERKLRVQLGDWKRSKAISKSGYGNVGYKCCSSLPCSNFYKYSLQLNLYRYLLEKNYNMIVESMTMYVFHATNETYLEFVIQDYQVLIREMIEMRIAGNFAEITPD